VLRDYKDGRIRTEDNAYLSICDLLSSHPGLIKEFHKFYDPNKKYKKKKATKRKTTATKKKKTTATKKK